MRSGPRKIAFVLLLLSLTCAVSPLLARKKDADTGQNERKRAIHALNRLTFGPRPGDVQRVMSVGVDKWIDLQLHPDKINDSALDARLEPFRATRLGSRELAEDFPDPQEIKDVMDRKKSMPSDAARRAVFEVQLARIENRKERKEDAAGRPASADKPGRLDNPANMLPSAPADRMPNSPADSGMNSGNMAGDSGTNVAGGNDSSMTPPAPATPSREEAVQAQRREERLYADLEVQELPNLPPDQRYKKVLGMVPETQLILANLIRDGKGQDFLEGLNPRQKEVLLAMNNPMNVVTEEQTQAKLVRAIYSERQLDEVMTDFWFNHFNVFAGKGIDHLFLPSYERDVIRPRALGKFEDLLVATARSPAMLFYLDNWLSVGPNSLQALGYPRPNGPYWRRFPRPRPGSRNRSGLNENYGRELMELHTLSVNGGYSQRDVTEVAKVFTGWTIDRPFEGGGFKFDPFTHEPGPKFVLGHKIKPRGEDEGLQVLHILATSPQTAHFISLKLAQRFVSDDPPPALVDRMAKSFLKKKGDIREVLSTLFHSPEFWADTTYRAKVKTPLEFVASAVRATGADVADAAPLARQLNNLGMPLFGAQPPTGYSMKAETWVSSAALLNRMNFSLALTAGKLRGITLDSAQLAGSDAPPAEPVQALTTLENVLLAGDVSKQTHDSIASRLDDPKITQRKLDDAARPPDVSAIAGLLLGSPEFQRR